MQYNYIALSNVFLIDKVYRNNIINILGELNQLIFCKSDFGHNNSHFNTISQYKTHLMNVSMLFIKNLDTRITY